MSRQEEFAQGHGLYWRIHDRDRPFSREDAWSQPMHFPERIDYPHMSDDEYAAHEAHYNAFKEPRQGYSSFTTPEEVHSYVRRTGLEHTNADLIGFRGERVGEGIDREPLVLPHSDEPEHRSPYPLDRGRKPVRP